MTEIAKPGTITADHVDIVTDISKHSAKLKGVALRLDLRSAYDSICKTESFLAQMVDVRTMEEKNGT